MQVTEPEVSLQYMTLYQATIRQAVERAADLMARLVAHTRGVLRELEDKAEDRRERDRLNDARRLLNQFEAILCSRFTEEVMTAFARMASAERARPADESAVHFDQIAAMDAAQVQRSVEVARARQAADDTLDPALAELNSAICVALGLPETRLERNPLRPVVYVEGITAAVTHLPVPTVVRQGWITVMTGALGQQQALWYLDMAARLRDQGSDAIPGAAAHSATGRDAAQREGKPQLTLERLRKLLAEPVQDDDSGLGLRYTPQEPSWSIDSQPGYGDSVPTGFKPTVPAAFDAARELKQVDHIIERIERRKAPGTVADDGPLDMLRAQARAAAHGLEQSLGVEVVTMMIDNITHDRRLLSPVQRAVADLEPALLQLAKVDPRFFSHKQHPARRLLHEITHRSIAFESVDSRGFSGFMEPLREVLAPLSLGVVETAEPFDKALGRLVEMLDDPQAREKRQLARAVRALKKAEQRNALAATMAMDVLARQEAALVPDAILDFLCGPWAQVVAHARMDDRTGASDPGHYAGMVDDILWSAQPHLTRKKVPALTRLVPRLLAQLRTGLATIDYPAQKTSEFFEVLMHLHQRGFKPEGEPAAPPVSSHSRESRNSRMAQLAADSTWIAPAEAQLSGFIEVASAGPLLSEPVPLGGLKQGAWVALHADGGWTRTRLCWVSGNGSLLLFSDALGFLQSLTRQACEQLLVAGKLRLISADPVEDALDAVARTAVRNSVDIRF